MPLRRTLRLFLIHSYRLLSRFRVGLLVLGSRSENDIPVHENIEHLTACKFLARSCCTFCADSVYYAEIPVNFEVPKIQDLKKYMITKYGILLRAVRDVPLRAGKRG